MDAKEILEEKEIPSNKCIRWGRITRIPYYEYSLHCSHDDSFNDDGHFLLVWVNLVFVINLSNYFVWMLFMLHNEVHIEMKNRTVAAEVLYKLYIISISHMIISIAPHKQPKTDIICVEWIANIK